MCFRLSFVRSLSSRVSSKMSDPEETNFYPPRAFSRLIQGGRFDGLSAEVLDRLVATCEWYGLSVPEELLRQRAGEAPDQRPHPESSTEGGESGPAQAHLEAEADDDASTLDGDSPTVLPEKCYDVDCDKTSSWVCKTCACQMCDKHLATCLHCAARTCLNCAFVGHICANDEWVADLEFTAAEVDLRAMSPDKPQEKKEAEKCEWPEADPFGTTPRILVQTRALEDLFGEGPGFEFVAVDMDNGELHWSLAPRPSLWWKSHRASLANAKPSTPRVFDGWLPPEDAQTNAAASGAKRTAAGMILSAYMREANEPLEDFKALSVACTAWALLRPSMVWLALPDALTERDGDNPQLAPSPCRLASLLPVEPSADGEAFTMIEAGGCMEPQEGASMGWHAIEHRRPVACTNAMMASEAEEAEPDSPAAPAHAETQPEPLDFSADELEGRWVL